VGKITRKRGKNKTPYPGWVEGKFHFVICPDRLPLKNKYHHS
jgi:hypothetical protein